MVKPISEIKQFSETENELRGNSCQDIMSTIFREDPASVMWAAAYTYQNGQQTLKEAASLTDLSIEQFQTFVSNYSVRDIKQLPVELRERGTLAQQVMMTGLTESQLGILVQLSYKDILFPRNPGYHNSIVLDLDFLVAIKLVIVTEWHGLLRYGLNIKTIKQEVN